MRVRFRNAGAALALAIVFMWCECLCGATAQAQSAPPTFTAKDDGRASPANPPVVRGTPTLIAPPAIKPSKLPEATVQELCDRFDGQPSFDDAKGQYKIDCDVVHRLVARQGESILQQMQRVLWNSQTLTGLRTTHLPTDMSCGQFEEYEKGEERVVHCSTAIGDKSMQFDFIGDRDGYLLRVEMDLHYRSVMDDTLKGAVRRGVITKYYPTWVDLLVAINVAYCKYHAGSRDTVVFDGDELRIVEFNSWQR